MTKSSSSQQPTKIPPAKAQSKTANSKETTPLENMAIASVKSTASATTSPSKIPPAASTSGSATSALGAAGGGATAALSSAATINALWSINQDKNSWIGVAGIGWKKLSYGSDSGIVSLTMLSTHAKQLGSTVYYREEADGMVHEIYAW